MSPRLAAPTCLTRLDRVSGRNRSWRHPALRPPRPLLALALAVTSLSAVPGARAVGDGLRAQDEVWWVSTRQVGCAAADAAPALQVERLEPDGGWRETALGEVLRAGDRDAILVVFVHGNRVSSAQSRVEGRQVYEQLTADARDATPVRFVIWSWPSARVKGPLRDVRAKAQRTEIDGYLLGWFLTQLPRTQRVSLLGYSFGARIATGALHLSGGGALSGRTLPHAPSDPLPLHVVTLAAALPDTWLRPGGYHQCALLRFDYLLNLYNRCDPVLRRYHWLTRHSRSTALGFSGLRPADRGDLDPTIDQCDVSGSVRKSHELHDYLHNACLRQRVADALFWHPAPAGAVWVGSHAE